MSFAVIVALGGPIAAQQEDAPPDSGTPTTVADEAVAQSVKGRLKHGDAPVAGATITVRSGASEVGTATTAADGSWEVPLTAAGSYTVTIDATSLPTGVALRKAGDDTRTITVRPGQRRTVLFPLGEGRRAAAAKDSALERIVNLAAIGVKLGLLVALTAVGLSLIYGVANLVNFAHGELVTFGALVAYFFNASGGGPGMPLAAAAVVAVAAGAAGGFLLERGMFAPLRRRRTEGISLIVFTIGLSLLVRHVFLVIMGAEPRPYTDYTLQRAVDFGPISLPPKDFAIAGIAAVVLVAVALLLQRTRIGTGMRAVADNRMLAEASGINVDRVIRFTWVLGGALAALGGVLLGVTEQVAWNMGFSLLLFMFAAVVVGGLGTAYGAMVGGLLVGIVSQTSTYWIDIQYKDAMALGVLILVLMVRPQGILGTRERVG